MPFCVICSRHLLPVVSAFPPVRTTWIGLRFPHMYLSPPRSVLPGGPRLPVPLPMPVLRRVLSPPYKAAALPFTCTRFTPTASLPPLRAADRTRPSLPVPFPSRMTICTTVLVSPLTPTPVRGAKAAPPTTSIMPLPANPPAAIMHLPPPITGPVLHIK